MASGGAIRAGRAFVELFADDSKLRQGLNRASRSMKNFSAKVGQIGATVFAAGGAMAAAFVQPVKAASDLGEATSKLDAVFGDSAEAVKRWGDETATQIGMSKREIREFLGGAQDLLVPVGVDPKTATETSKSLVQLAADLGSFNNRDTADVMGDLQSALVGSSETMLKYGVIVNQAAVNQRLLDQGINPKSATDAQKVMARYGIILEGTTAAQGDFARTSGGLANRTKTLRSSLENLSSEVGSTLTPAVENAVGVLDQVVNFVARFASENQAIIQVAAIVAGSLMALGSALLVVAGIGVVASTALAAISSTIGILASPFVLVSGAIAGTVGALLYFSGVGGTVVEFIKGKFGELWNYLKPTFEAISSALSSGEYGKAAEILWLQLKAAWLQGTADLQRLWIAFKVETAKVFVESTVSLLNTWDQFTGGMMDAFDVAVNHIVDAWKFVQTKIAGLIVDVMAFFDPTINAEEAKADLEAANISDAQRRDEERDRRIVDRERNRDTSATARRKAADDTVAELDKDLETQLDGVNDAIAMAQQKVREARDSVTSPDVASSSDSPDVEDARDKARSSFSQAKSVAGGTFSTLAGRQIGVGGVAEKQLKVSQQIAANTEEAARNSRKTPDSVA